MGAQSSRKELRARAAAVPIIEQPDIAHLLSETESSAMEYDLESLGSDSIRRIKLTANMIYTEVSPELQTGEDDQHFVISADQLKGIIHKATRRGATQALYDTGGVLRESQSLEEILLVEGPGASSEDI